ncbi:hypothetical protein KBB49_04285 [Candidatus Saccharibacteria bacterium]|nr:hypothetical protein [Candidatus Saccharibacteria bacterium]
MNTKAVLLVGGGLSVSSGFWFADRVNDDNYKAGMETAINLEDCANTGLDTEGCRVLVESQVAPDIVNNSLGYTAVFTKEKIIETAKAIEENPSDSLDGNVIGVVIASAVVGGTGLIALTTETKKQRKKRHGR